jgi:hypothetical protein
MKKIDGAKQPAVTRDPPGIVIRDGVATPPKPPAISAFVYGGRVRPIPTLPFGRWRLRSA